MARQIRPIWPISSPVAISQISSRYYATQASGCLAAAILLLTTAWSCYTIFGELSNVELIESQGIWYTIAIVLQGVPSKVPVKIGYFALTFASHEKVIAPHEGKNRDHH